MGNEDAFREGFFAGETGATMVEYALLIALIAIACLAAVSTLARGVKEPFEKLGEMLDDLYGD